MFSKKYLIILLLILIFNISVNHVDSSEIDRLQIYIKLENGDPLSNATVKICFDLSTRCIENKTDENGLTVFELKESFNFLRLYVNYGIYGEIYYYRLKNIANGIVEKQIPFKKLFVNYTVVDEYRNPLNGTYSLTYVNKLLSTGDFYGKIIINENLRVDNTYLLINTRKPYESIDERIVNIEYNMNIKVNSEERVLKINYMSSTIDELVIDIYEPIIKLLDKPEILYIPNKEIPLYAKIIVDFNVIDGLNTGFLSIKAFYKWEHGYENEIPPNSISIVNKDNYSIHYRLEFDIKLHGSYRDQMLILKLVAIDPSNKRSECLLKINVWNSINESVTKRDQLDETTNPVEQQTSTIVNSLERNTSYTDFIETSGFEIESKSESNKYFNYVFLTGPIISIIILIIEFKRYRREHNNSY